MFKSKKLAILAALLSLLMLVSLMAVPAFAEEATTTDVVTEAVTDPESETDTEAVSGSETTAKEDTTKEDTTKKEETTTGESAAEKAEKKERLTRGIINLSVGVVLLGVLVFLAIKFRAKIPGWWKSLKSECGKITWCPKDKLKKNVIVVVVIILAIAVVIGVLDVTFSTVLEWLKDLVSGLSK